MSETVYPQGIVIFQPSPKAPDFVKGSVKVSLNKLVAFCKENPDLLDDYKGEKQLPLQLLEGDKGLYFKVDTYRPDSNGGSKGSPPLEDDSELPF